MRDYDGDVLSVGAGPTELAAAIAAKREGLSALVLDVNTRRGERRIRHAPAVVPATGSCDSPNLLGVPGEDLPYVFHDYSEPHPYSLELRGRKTEGRRLPFDYAQGRQPA